MQSHLPSAALTALLAAVPLLAQGSYTAHPLDNPLSSTSQNIPIAGNSATWDEARSQYLFLAPFLPSTGGLLTAIDYVPSASGTTTYERFEIWVDHTTNSTLSTTFANNLTNPQLVLQISNGPINWIGATWSPIVFTTPFAYDGTSNLVVEIRKQINRTVAPPPTISHRVLVWPRRTDLPPPIWAYGAYGSGAVDAATATTTYSTSLLTRLEWLAVPATLNIDSTRDVTGLASRSYFHLNATMTMTTRGPAGEFYLGAIDFALSPAGFPVPPMGGELWFLMPQIYAGGFLDAAGTATDTITIPNDPLLIGLRAFLQHGVLGTTFLFTNVVDAPIAAY